MTATGEWRFRWRHGAPPRGLLVATAIAGALVMGVALPLWLAGVVLGLPDRAALRRLGEMPQATVFYDVHGRPAFQVFDEHRLQVPLEAISPHLVDAILAVEDRRFYRHRGVDPVRLTGALVANLRAGRLAQGGSTITQQLARMSLLTRSKTFTRKAQELLLALWIEREYTKAEILELYLNRVYFGAGLYGAEAAAQGYFGKPARALTLAEAALLAGLVRSPSSDAPTVSLERALARRDLVLRVMREAGVIDAEAERAARAERIAATGRAADRRHGHYFREQVRQELVARFGRERVHRGGLRVHTTYDPAMQAAAERAVARGLVALERRRAALASARGRAARDPLQAALIAIDPRNGHVRAMVGGRRFAESPFNRAVQARRQPGSAFKPFVYAAALEAGYTPASVIEPLDEPVWLASGPWVPRDTHDEAQALTMREALRLSSNRAAVRMLDALGPPRVVRAATHLGLPGLPPVPALALGAGEVTLQALTAAFAVFASGGVRHEPVLVLRVEDADGTLLYEAPPTATPVIAPATAYQMASMLADVIDRGTAWRVRQLGFRLPAAGKTGTTNDYHDAWFVGFTPRLAAGVWIGFDRPQPILPGGYASDVAVPVWAAFMQQATAGHPADWLPRPPDVASVEICRLSGLRATPWCQEGGEGEVARSTAPTYVEHFAKGTEPVDSCPLHGGGRSFFRWFGSLFRR